jgi:hypothetical protein
VIGVVDALRRFNAAKSPTFFHKASGDIEEVTVTLESSAKAAPVDISIVAAAVEIATMRTCRLLPGLF